MIEALDLGNTENISQHRDAIVADLPNILAVAGAHDQVLWLEQGRHDDVVAWFRGTVSTGAHGANEGLTGLTPEQTLDFNPLAREHGLMAPTRLWTPEDDLPEGAKIGDIANYSVLPEYASLAEQVFKSNEIIVVDARFDGTIGRIDAALGVAVRSPLPADGLRRVTVLTGMRAIGPDEGATGLYKQFLPSRFDAEATPIERAFPSATDAALAILQARCSKFDLIEELEDSVLGDKAANRVAHPVLGTRDWVTRTYSATHESGVDLRVTVVNGEPIAPTGQEMNRSTKVPAPTAAETLKDYLRSRNEHLGPVNLGISYAHLGRIGAELVNATRLSSDTPSALGTISLVGSMPQKATWGKIIKGNHNGGTLGYKEVYPYIKALNALLGRSANDLGL